MTTTQDLRSLKAPYHPAMRRWKTNTFSSRYQRHSSSSSMTLPHHQAVHVTSVMSCHVMNFHKPRHHCGSCIFKMYCKVEVPGTHMEYEESCRLKGHRNSNSHEGSQRVTRRVKHHPLVIYTPSLCEQRTFHLGSSHKELERQIGSF